MKELILILVGMLLGVLVLATANEWNTKGSAGYKKGHIDALTGNVKMELINNADSTKSWEWID